MNAKVIIDLNEFDELRKKAKELNDLAWYISQAVDVDIQEEGKENPKINFVVDLNKLEKVIKKYALYYKDEYDWIENLSEVTVVYKQK